VRQAQFGNLEETLRKAMASAYTIGGPGGEKPDLKIAANTSQTAASVNELKDKLNGLWTDVKQILNDAPVWITEVLPVKVYHFMLDAAKQAMTVGRDIGNRGVEVPGTGGAKITIADAVAPQAKFYDRATDVIDRLGGPRLPKVF
jgi:hypothetical protein